MLSKCDLAMSITDIYYYYSVPIVKAPVP
jgi:hypothetical protein